MKKAIYAAIGGALLFWISFEVLIKEINPVINGLCGVGIMVGSVISVLGFGTIIVLSFSKYFPKKNS